MPLVDARPVEHSAPRTPSRPDPPTIAVGSAYSCAVTRLGRVKCWGLDYAGQLGTGATTDSTPLAANGLPIGLVPVDVDFAHQRPPATDAVDGVVRDGRTDLPLLAIVAGLAAGLRMLVRRRPELARAASGPMLE